MSLARRLLLASMLSLSLGCGLQVTSGDMQSQIKSLSQILHETDVQTCTKVTAQMHPYVQAITIWAGRTPLEDCLRAFYPN